MKNLDADRARIKETEARLRTADLALEKAVDEFFSKLHFNAVTGIDQ
jgi:hypothetical protein